MADVMTHTPIAPGTLVLVTGANGFVGRAVSDALGRHGHAVRRALRRVPSPPASGDSVVVGDMDGRTDWSAALRDIRTIVHLAGRAHVLHDDATDPLAAYRTVNTAGTLRLAEQAAASGVRRLVFVSTVKVNGETTAPGQPFTETVPGVPTDPYALSKHEAERGLRAIAERTGMEVVIIRPPLVYGPGVRANFAALMRAVARGWPLPLGALHNRRSLIALDNLVDVILRCVDHPAAANQTFLVSDGEDLSTTDLARRIARAMGRPARLLPVPAPLLTAAASLVGRRGVASRLCDDLQVDIGHARRVLGWTPPITVDEGLRRATQGVSW